MVRLIVVLGLLVPGNLSLAQVRVRGYYRENGTYVPPRERTRPNHTSTDNYSYPGNYNPNTGRITGSPSSASYTTAPIVPARPGYSTSGSTKEPIPARPVDDGQLYAETEANAALRDRASYKAPSIYVIPKGAVVKIDLYDDYYYRAEVNGRSGYICICQVKKTVRKL